MEPNFVRGFTLEDALKMVYEEDIPAESIYVEPPACNVLTDEESGDEDDEDDEGDIDHLPPRQLTAQAELVLPNNKRIDRLSQLSDIDEDMTSTEIQNAADGQQKEKKKRETRKKEERKNRTFSWIKGDIENNCCRDFPIPDYSDYVNKTPAELFELFLDSDLCSLIINESTKYAAFRNWPDPKLTEEELKCTLAILILSGYNKLPGRRFYWNSKNDMHNNMVADAMRRNRFFQIMQCLHFADNANPSNVDKMWKLRPLMDKLKRSFLTHFIPEQSLDYDESMIRYYGHHGCKQFIRGKPIRFGFKMWSLNTTSGYLVNFDLYQGKGPNSNEEDDITFGKATSPLLQMIREFPENKKNMPYQFYIDNLFRSVNLLVNFKEQGYGATGTMRVNRIPKNIPLPNKKTFAKNAKKGDFASIIDKNSGIIFVSWLDNNVVTMASTSNGVAPISQVKRYSRVEKKYTQVNRPNLIRKYNNGMGGTDLMDQNISRYRISMRSKKWWWCVFSWLIDVSIENAWIIHKKSGGKLCQLEFRREIVISYLQRYGTPPKGPGRPAVSKTSLTLNRVADDVRYDGKGHLLIRIPNNKRRRCAGEGCCSSGRTMCNKCDVGLCVDCNLIFHSP